MERNGKSLSTGMMMIFGIIHKGGANGKVWSLGITDSFGVCRSSN